MITPVMSLAEILAIVCEVAGTGIDRASQTLEAVGLTTNQQRDLFRTRLRQRLAGRGLHVTNTQIPADAEVTLWGIAQTVALSVSRGSAESAAFRFGGPADSETHNYATRRVFYATDRKPTGSTAPANFFGSERAFDGALVVGSCEISVPRDHRMAALENPSIWRLEFRENPEKHVVLLSVDRMDEPRFYTGLAADLGEDKQAFVFVHGYNVSFEDAARRTGQLAYDLAFPGAAIFFSWPSFHSVPSYAADEAAVEWCTPHLRDFLGSLRARTGAERIHLIAHSMGNRALTRALESLSVGIEIPIFHQIVLTAPDIDRGVFLQLANRIQKTGERVTLYASTNDLALHASEGLHGGPRAGESGNRIIVLDGVDTVDASTIDASLMGHSYFGSNRSVIADLFCLLDKGYPPPKCFGLRKIDWAGKCYWKFSP